MVERTLNADAVVQQEIALHVFGEVTAADEFATAGWTYTLRKEGLHGTVFIWVRQVAAEGGGEVIHAA